MTNYCLLLTKEGVSDPIFWLGLSLLLVAVSLTALLVALLPAIQELARAARSAEKLFDTLRRDFPPTLEAIRLTGLEISELTDDIDDGVKSAGQVVQKVDNSLSTVKKQADNVGIGTKSMVAGVKAAWKTWQRPSPKRRPSTEIPSKEARRDRLSASSRPPLEWQDPTQSSREIYPQEPDYEPKREDNPDF